MTEIAIKRKLTDTINEYDAKKAAIPQALKEYEAACDALKMACTVGGTYSRENRIKVETNYERDMYQGLLKSAWYNLYEYLQLETIAPNSDKKQFEQSMVDAPEFTLENIRASFGDYVLNPWDNIIRGLAEVFCSLDQSYKSHEKVKIGVKGLPKRIIMSNITSYGWGRDKLLDVLNALAAYQNKALLSYGDISDLLADGDCFKTNVYKDGQLVREARGVWLKTFANGNGHLFFAPDTLTDINKALAAYYGDVMADGYTERPDKPQASTDVAKDLQYYPTPVEVVDRVLEDLYRLNDERILEPSCGCGRIMDGLRERGAKPVGFEIHAGRVQQCIDKGHKAMQANFLETAPNPVYDRVVMNPPFYGRHYEKHVKHAMAFLKPGGILTAILPITARDHGTFKGKWRDLGFGAFKESGTNINTTVLTMIKEGE